MGAFVLRSSVVAAQAATAEQDWINRSTAAGVTQSLRFTSASAVTGYVHGDALQSNPVWVAGGGIIGDGCLRIPVLRSHGASSGAWRAPLNSAWVTDGQGFGASEFYIQFRMRLGPGRLTQTTGGGGFKVANFAGYRPQSPDSSASFTDHEIVLNNQSWRRSLFAYRNTGSGATGLEVTDGPDIYLQPALDRGVGVTPNTARYCLYPGSSGCWEFPDQEWFTVKVRLKIPSYGGSAGNEFDVWVSKDGDSTWTQLYNSRNFSISADAQYPNGINGVWFLAYDTGRSSASYDTYHEYDQLIVSTQDIALPMSIAAPASAAIAAMTDKTWQQIATVGNVAAVQPAVSPGGTNPANGMFTAWCGAAVDSRRKTLRIDAQGGHNDYHGNESYALDLRAPTPAWARVRDPSASFGSDPLMSDGAPRAAHGQGQIVYAANVDKVILTGLPYTAPNGNQFKRFFGIDCSSNVWSELATPAAGYGDNTYYHGGSAYDPYTGYVWTVATTSSANSTTRFDPVGNVHTLYSPAQNQGYDGKAAISPSRRCMLYLNGNTSGHDGTFVWLDLSSPTLWRSPAAVTGTPASTEGAPLVWHEASGGFLSWTSGTSLFKLTPPADLVNGTWAWTSVAVDAANAVTPTARQSTGTYGRFSLVENLQGRDYLVLVNAANQATYVYKLPRLGV